MPEAVHADPIREELELVRSSALRRLRHHLRGWSAHRIEEAVQEVCLGYLHSVRREGPPEHREGLVAVIARRRATTMIRHERFERLHGSLEDGGASVPDPDSREERLDLEEETSLLVHRIIAFMRAHKAECEPLAIARAQGEDFKQLAQRLGRTHAGLLQTWSRCMRRLKQAARRGEIDLLGRIRPESLE